MNSDHRKVAPAASENDDSADKQDHLFLSVSICNGEDLGPFVRKAFAAGTPETLLAHLRSFRRSKEAVIEEVCRDHYQEFITAVDDLRSLLSDVDKLKSSLAVFNSQLENGAVPLLTSLDSIVEARNKAINIRRAVDSLGACIALAELCSRVNSHLAGNSLYMALKCLDAIEGKLIDKTTPSSTLRRMVEKLIPEIRAHIERKASKEFGDWLVEIRAVSRSLGQVAIGQASASRQREEELRKKQRQAEEQSRISLLDRVCALYEEDDDEEIDSIKFDLTPLYRAHHIHQTLGLGDRFRKYYFENRKLQLMSDFQVSSMTPFLESHQTFFAQIAGFFLVEDRVLRTGGGLISKPEVESLWDTAVSKMCSVLEDEFSSMDTANHMLLIKDYVSLLGVTMRRYGYNTDALLDVLSMHRYKYHELLLSDCRKQISEALAADNLDQMYMKKAYEYSMNVLSFQLQTSKLMPAFPYVSPFSSMVPDCCRIVRSFIEDSVSFMSYGGQLDFYDVVKKYLDRLLSEVLDGALLKVIDTNVNGVTQAMQMAANMAVFERACEFFFRHAAHLSGIPYRMAESGNKASNKVFPLIKARDSAEEMLSGNLKRKIDGFMSLIQNVNWMADEAQQEGNEYADEVIKFLEARVSTAQQILPESVLKRVLQDLLYHISEGIVRTLAGDSVKRFNINAVKVLNVDIQMLESFADDQAWLLSDGVEELKEALMESRLIVNLLLSNHPEMFFESVINALDYRKVCVILEKMGDPAERRFGSFGSSFGSRGNKPNNAKKRSLDSIVKRLKEMS